MTLNKYQDLMNKVQVTDEMRDRVLHNIEQKLAAEASGKAPAGTSTGPVQAPGKKKIVNFSKYMPMAATFAILLLGAFAVITVLPSQHHVSENAATSEIQEYAAEAEMAEDTTDSYEEAAEATEEPAYEAEATEEPAYEAEATEESDYAKATQSTGAVKEEEQPGVNSAQPDVTANVVSDERPSLIGRILDVIKSFFKGILDLFTR